VEATLWANDFGDWLKWKADDRARSAWNRKVKETDDWEAADRAANYARYNSLVPMVMEWKEPGRYGDRTERKTSAVAVLETIARFQQEQGDELSKLRFELASI